MGYSSWSDDSYRSIKTNYSTQSQSQVFQNTAKNTIDPDMSPLNLVLRESRDSVEHPNSFPLLVGLDETGSMGDIPEYLIKNKLGTLITTIIDHGVPDIQILFAGVGDHHSDDFPIQVGQFESGTTELDRWLTGINLEANGGGNGGESYFLSWIVAGRYTSIDSFEKRGVKGVLFTIGDEPLHSSISASAFKQLFGTAIESEITAEQALAEAQRMYEVFHIHINHSSYRSYVSDGWKKLLGENLIILNDKDNVSETIATTVALLHGASLKDVTSNMSSSTANSVSTALMHLENTLSVRSKNSDQGVMVL